MRWFTGNGGIQKHMSFSHGLSVRLISRKTEATSEKQTTSWNLTAPLHRMDEKIMVSKKVINLSHSRITERYDTTSFNMESDFPPLKSIRTILLKRSHKSTSIMYYCHLPPSLQSCSFSNFNRVTFYRVYLVIDT